MIPSMIPMKEYLSDLPSNRETNDINNKTNSITTRKEKSKSDHTDRTPDWPCELP
jgi:hypothetical protein